MSETTDALHIVPTEQRVRWRYVELVQLHMELDLRRADRHITFG
jgi:hypothetical protein